MQLPLRRVLSWWIDVWRGDRHASDLAMQGEHRAAQARLLIVGVLTFVGLVVVIVDPSNLDFAQSLPVNLVCVTASFALLMGTRRGSRPRRLALMTVIADISAVSLLQVGDLLQNHPSVVVNSRVTFGVYFLALVGTCIRFDPALALIGGVVAALEYAGIAFWGASIWPAAVTVDVMEHGQFFWGVQVERVVMLLLFAGACASIARWTVELRASATNDTLTGLLNRRTFEEQLHGEILRAQRRGEPISVAMIDIDNFKRVNDAYGHHIGDYVLKEIAAMIRQAVRRTDLAGRWGGEEFVLAFPSEGSETADAHLERLRATVEARHVQLPPGDSVALTISGGVAYLPDDGEDGASLLRVADDRLLEAKRSGRNRLVARSTSRAPSRA